MGFIEDITRGTPFKAVFDPGGIASNVLFGPDMSGLEDASRDAEKFYREYTPQNYAARQRALQQASQLFGPVNNMLTQMYGPQAALSPEQTSSVFADPAPQFAQGPQAAPSKFFVPPGPAGTAGWGH